MRALQIEHSITRRDQKSLNRYLQDISQHEVLSIQEEVDLFKRLEQGDQLALDKIVKHNLRFVVSVAKQYQNLGLSLNDLVNEGNVGLIKAARRFDVTRGFKFISYAVWWIRQSILAAVQAKSNKIRLPSNQQSINSKIKKEKITFLQQHERQPSVEELSELTGLPVQHVKQNQQRRNWCQSLDRELKAGEDTTLGQVLADTNIKSPDFSLAIRESQKEQVKSLLSLLSDREVTVLRMYYGLGQKHNTSLQDIGDFLGLTKERVRQIRDRSIRKLRLRGRSIQPVFA